jgi:hypothetical protein
MKKILAVLLAIVLAVPSFAQEKTANFSTEKNVLKINTLSLICATGSIFYERKISDMTSLQMGVAYLGYKFSDVKFSGLILTPEFRIYPKKAAIDGMYIAPYVRYQNFSASSGETDSKGTLSVIGGGLLFGRQWITNSGFTMDLFFGGHYGSANVKLESGTDSDELDLFSGFRVRAGFALGFAF